MLMSQIAGLHKPAATLGPFGGAVYPAGSSPGTGARLCEWTEADRLIDSRVGCKRTAAGLPALRAH